MGIEIQTFRSDFETDFPGLGVECCFFYFGQANWRKISELRFKQSWAYVEDFQGRRAREKTQESGIRVSLSTSRAWPIM